MSPKKRAGIAQAFRECLFWLWDGTEPLTVWKEEYICYALDATEHPYSEAAMDVVRKRIGLEPMSPLDSWLLRQIGEKRYREEVTHQRMQNYRKRWVRRLIREFEA